jgi:hypothetical protein|tara:strand:+ start:440 stop:664 length:225 start_codon:yes stop_codon:yes gene_type:complete
MSSCGKCKKFEFRKSHESQRVFKLRRYREAVEHNHFNEKVRNKFKAELVRRGWIDEDGNELPEVVQETKEVEEE